MSRDKKFKKAVRERMARTGEAYSTARHSLLPHCTAVEPCPASADPMKWIHEFETTYEGAIHNTLTCKHCGFQCQAAAPR